MVLNVGVKTTKPWKKKSIGKTLRVFRLGEDLLEGTKANMNYKR